MHLKRRFVVTLLVAAAVAISGCGGDKKTPAAKPKAPPISDQAITRTLDIKVTGTRTLDYHGPARMRFVIRSGEGIGLEYSVVSIAAPELIKVQEGLSFWPEIGLVGMYKGDGEYRVPAGVGQAPPNGPRVTAPGDATAVSIAQVTFVEGSPKPTSETRYGYVLEPCKVTLKAKTTRGSATCPALLAVDGGRVSMTVSWDE